MDSHFSFSLVPIRCYTCGAPIGQFQGRYMEMISGGVSPKDALNHLGIERYCCRDKIMNPVSVAISTILPFSMGSIYRTTKLITEKLGGPSEERAVNPYESSHGIAPFVPVASEVKNGRVINRYSVL